MNTSFVRRRRFRACSAVLTAGFSLGLGPGFGRVQAAETSLKTKLRKALILNQPTEDGKLAMAEHGRRLDRIIAGKG